MVTDLLLAVIIGLLASIWYWLKVIYNEIKRAQHIKKTVDYNAST